MPEIIGVKFKEAGKAYYFEPNGLEIKKGQKVIVETAQGVECGVCAIENTTISAEPETPLKPVLRIANEDDEKRLVQNEQKQKEAFSICTKKIAEHKLDMKLVSVEYTFDNSKILFYFTADGRVDFRALVKDLASVFRTRIELRQVGVRDEAKILGGIGICGREFCCSGFLNSFQPVSIKMAKEQNLSLNPVKISGTCGRLMCCLKYEQDAYEYLNRNSPRVGSTVKTPSGTGVITDIALLTRKVKVKIEGSGELLPEVFDIRDIKVLTDSRGIRVQPGNEIPEEDMPLEVDGDTAHDTADTSAAAPQPQRNTPPRTPRPNNTRTSRYPRQNSQPKTDKPKADGAEEYDVNTEKPNRTNSQQKHYGKPGYNKQQNRRPYSARPKNTVKKPQSANSGENNNG